MYATDKRNIIFAHFQPTADEHNADKKSLQTLLAQHKVPVNDAVSKMLQQYIKSNFLTENFGCSSLPD